VHSERVLYEVIGGRSCFNYARLMLWAASALVCVWGCDPRYGFIESNFALAPDSRLPRWIDAAQCERNCVSVDITLYTFHKARIVARCEAPEEKILFDKVGTKRWHPITEQRIKQGGLGYPSYSLISIGGVEELFERRRPEPLLYVTDGEMRRKLFDMLESVPKISPAG